MRTGVKPCERDTRRAGFTLIEVMIALALFALIAVAGFTLLDSVLRTQAATDDRLGRMAQVQRAMLVVSTDLDQITGALAGGAGTLTLQKDDLAGARVVVRYDLSGGTMTRTVSGPTGERVQVLITGVSDARWSFHRRRGDWLDAWPEITAPGLVQAQGAGIVVGAAETMAPDAGVTAVALDLTLDGFDGRPGATLRRVASIPLMQAQP